MRSKSPGLHGNVKSLLHLGTQLANEFANGPPVGELVAGRRFHHGKRNLKSIAGQDAPKQADLANRLPTGIPVD